MPNRQTTQSLVVHVNSSSIMAAGSHPTFKKSSPTVEPAGTEKQQTTLQHRNEVCYDAAIVYAKVDRSLALVVVNKLRELNLENNEHPKVCLYNDEEFGSSIVKHPQKLLEKCVLVLVLLTENFENDEHVQFINEETVGKSRLGTVPHWQKQCVRPIHSKPAKQRNYQLPPGLDSIRNYDVSCFISGHTPASMCNLCKHNQKELQDAFVYGRQKKAEEQKQVIQSSIVSDIISGIKMVKTDNTPSELDKNNAIEVKSGSKSGEQNEDKQSDEHTPVETSAATGGSCQDEKSDDDDSRSDTATESQENEEPVKLSSDSLSKVINQETDNSDKVENMNDPNGSSNDDVSKSGQAAAQTSVQDTSSISNQPLKESDLLEDQVEETLSSFASPKTKTGKTGNTPAELSQVDTKNRSMDKNNAIEVKSGSKSGEQNEDKQSDEHTPVETSAATGGSCQDEKSDDDDSRSDTVTESQENEEPVKLSSDSLSKVINQETDNSDKVENMNDPNGNSTDDVSKSGQAAAQAPVQDTSSISNQLLKESDLLEDQVEETLSSFASPKTKIGKTGNTPAELSQVDTKNRSMDKNNAIEVKSGSKSGEQNEDEQSDEHTPVETSAASGGSCQDEKSGDDDSRSDTATESQENEEPVKLSSDSLSKVINQETDNSDKVENMNDPNGNSNDDVSKSGQAAAQTDLLEDHHTMEKADVDEPNDNSVDGTQSGIEKQMCVSMAERSKQPVSQNTYQKMLGSCFSPDLCVEKQDQKITSVKKPQAVSGSNENETKRYDCLDGKDAEMTQMTGRSNILKGSDTAALTEDPDQTFFLKVQSHGNLTDESVNDKDQNITSAKQNQVPQTEKMSPEKSAPINKFNNPSPDSSKEFSVPSPSKPVVKEKFLPAFSEKVDDMTVREHLLRASGPADNSTDKLKLLHGSCEFPKSSANDLSTDDSDEIRSSGEEKQGHEKHASPEKVDNIQVPVQANTIVNIYNSNNIKIEGKQTVIIKSDKLGTGSGQSSTATRSINDKTQGLDLNWLPPHRQRKLNRTGDVKPIGFHAGKGWLDSSSTITKRPDQKMITQGEMYPEFSPQSLSFTERRKPTAPPETISSVVPAPTGKPTSGADGNNDIQNQPLIQGTGNHDFTQNASMTKETKRKKKGCFPFKCFQLKRKWKGRGK